MVKRRLDTIDGGSAGETRKRSRGVHARPILVTPSLLPGAALVIGCYYALTWAARYLTLDPDVYGARWRFAPLLFLHVVFGIVALLVGPFQFWSGLRHRHRRLHRWLGRTYVTAVAASVLCAAALLVLREHPINFELGVGGLALAWAGTTGLAYVAIRRRLIAEHREWMIRSYVVTCGFVLFRVIVDVMRAYEIGTAVERTAVASWACWAVPLLITEFILQGRRVFVRPGRTPRSTPAAPGQVYGGSVEAVQAGSPFGVAIIGGAGE